MIRTYNGDKLKIVEVRTGRQRWQVLLIFVDPFGRVRREFLRWKNNKPVVCRDREIARIRALTYRSQMKAKEPDNLNYNRW